MYYRFRKNHKVFVTGYGKKDGKFYNNVPAFIIERDTYYRDYLVRFKDKTEDWIASDDIRKPFERSIKKKRKRRKTKRRKSSKEGAKYGN